MFGFVARISFISQCSIPPFEKSQLISTRDLFAVVELAPALLTLKFPYKNCSCSLFSSLITPIISRRLGVCNHSFSPWLGVATIVSLSVQLPHQLFTSLLTPQSHEMDNHHSDPPAPDPIKDLVASFNQSLFVRASNLAGAAKMTSNSSLPDPPKPTKPPTQSLISNQRPLPSVPSMSSTVGQSQSTSSPSRALPPRSEPQSSIFGQPRSLESTPLPSDLSQSNTMGQSQSTLFPSWALPVRPEPHSSNFVQPKFLESVPNVSSTHPHPTLPD